MRLVAESVTGLRVLQCAPAGKPMSDVGRQRLVMLIIFHQMIC